MSVLALNKMKEDYIFYNKLLSDSEISYVYKYIINYFEDIYIRVIKQKRGIVVCH